MKQLLLLFFPLLLLSCSKNYNDAIHLTPKDCEDETSFCYYLADTLNAYITERTEWAIDDRTSPFSSHYYKMLYEYIFEDDSVRLNSFHHQLCSTGLSADSIETFIKKHVDVYNNYHPNNQLDYLKINEFSIDSDKDSIILTSMNALDKWEFIDFFLLFYGLLAVALINIFPQLLYVVYLYSRYVCWPISFVLGFLLGFIFLRPMRLLFGIEVDKETYMSIANVLRVLVSIMIFSFLLWLCIKNSIVLHDNLIGEYSEHINNQMF